MKRLNRLFSILLVTLLVTGCMKYNTQMSITAQGDVNLNLTVAFANSTLEMMEQMGEENSGAALAELDDETIAEYAKIGFKAEEYSDSLWTGIKLSKTYKIEESSSPNPVTISIMDFMEENPSILFQSLGNDTYKGHFIVKAEDMQNASAGMNSMDGMDQEQLEALYDSMDLSYSITLPSKPISHNADTVEGNTLTWKFKMDGVTDIQYEFSLKGSSSAVISNSNGNSSSNVTSNNDSSVDKKDNSTMWIIIGIAGVAVVLIIVVVAVVVSKKKKNSNTMMNMNPVGQMPQMTSVPMAPVQQPQPVVQPMPPQVPSQPVTPVQPVVEPTPVVPTPVVPATPVVEQPAVPSTEVSANATSDNQSNNVQ